MKLTNDDPIVVHFRGTPLAWTSCFSGMLLFVVLKFVEVVHFFCLWVLIFMSQWTLVFIGSVYILQWNLRWSCFHYVMQWTSKWPHYQNLHFIPLKLTTQLVVEWKNQHGTISWVNSTVNFDYNDCLVEIPIELHSQSCAMKNLMKIR
jgi:hypothetical protein